MAPRFLTLININNLSVQFAIIGTLAIGTTAVIICREIDTNLDGVKDIVRTYNEKGESLHEQADTNYDGRIDTWITFAGTWRWGG